MALVQPKQILKFITGARRVLTFSANGVDDVATAALTANLGALPVQVSSATQMGIITTGNNRVDIWDSTTLNKVIALGQYEVYGRLTEAAGVYTLTYYYNLAGVETSYTFAAPTNIDFIYLYQYDFANLPSDFAVVLPESYVAQDIANSGGIYFIEQLTPTALNTIPNLTQVPVNGNTVLLYANGVALRPTIDYTIAGQAITYLPLVSGYDVTTTDAIQAVYFRQ